MKRILLAFSACVFLSVAEASWYWPFGDSEDEPPRLSELIEKASELIGEASDLASDGKVTDAVKKYQEALIELDRVEKENPERAKTTEFSSLKTKRAYVEATIDALLMNQARQNAKPVAVSDTTELEKRLERERRGATGEAAQERKIAPRVRKTKTAVRKAEQTRPLTKREEVMKAIGEQNFERADRLIAELLEAKPNNAAALNLRAALETAEGKYQEAEKTLDSAITSNPRDHFAYYNMAILKLQTRKDDRDGARRYYETGRAIGGPKDEAIEEMLK